MKKSGSILVGLIAAVLAAMGISYWIVSAELIEGDVFSVKLLLSAVAYYAAMLLLLWYSAKFEGAFKWWIGVLCFEAVLVLAAVFVTNAFAKMQLFLACLLVLAPNAVFLPIISNTEGKGGILFIVIGLLAIHLIFTSVFLISKKINK